MASRGHVGHIIEATAVNRRDRDILPFVALVKNCRKRRVRGTSWLIRSLFVFIPLPWLLSVVDGYANVVHIAGMQEPRRQRATRYVLEQNERSVRNKTSVFLGNSEGLPAQRGDRDENHTQSIFSGHVLQVPHRLRGIPQASHSASPMIRHSQ